MNQNDAPEQLNMIATWWPTVEEAHSGMAGAATFARHSLLERYNRAAHRYLLGAVRDPDVAGDLSQEFALRLLRGDFRRANPARGRFRDYLRSVLMNLVHKHFRSRQRRPHALPDYAPPVAREADPSAAAAAEDNSLRDRMLERTWAALRKVQPRYHQVLRTRADSPDASSAELAEMLTAATGECWKADQVRKILERARSAFVGLLLEEASSALNSRGDAWDALAELGLLPYCRGAIERRAKAG